jgi:hypothetical protein
MAKKSKPVPGEENKSASEYYHLNTRAVDDLVDADVSNSPKVSEAELRQYRSGPRIRLSDLAKALIIKWWFSGAVCFFFLWGLGTLVPSMENQLIILGLALGVVTDLLTNNVFRFYAKTPHANDQWMFFPERRYITLPLNILYSFVILFFVVLTYNVINVTIVHFTGVQDSVPLGVGPILFGCFCTAWDLLFIRFKLLLRSILRDARLHS